MQGLVRAGLRLALMALVTGAVLVTATGVGLPAAAVLGLSLTVAGLVGMLSMTRRAAEEAAPLRAAVAPAFAVAAPTVPRHRLPAPEPAPARVDVAPDPDMVDVDRDPAGTIDRDRDRDRGGDRALDPLVAAMAPGEGLDPELLMPRWRRPSLLAARRSDPTRVTRTERPAMRFSAPPDSSSTRRIVRYAVVPILDRPDEVLGRQVVDLIAGDEVDVLQANGSFWEVACPDGMRGWVHRTTLGTSADGLSIGRLVPEPEPDDLLSAVLSARGIQ